MGIGSRIRHVLGEAVYGNKIPRIIEQGKGRLTPVQPPSTATFSVNKMKTDFSEAMPGFSQPVWGPEINTVGAYSREGYTSKTFDTPVIPFNQQVLAAETDEDVQLAINHLSSQITGGEHYWKGANDQFVSYMEDFSTAIDFDWFDTILVKELLWHGNSVWKPRMGVANIRSKDDLMHIPISSFVRIWWDRQRIPYKLEFRGSQYQGYHNPGEVIHFAWNPINASAFGNGFASAMLSPRDFEQITSAGPINQRLPSLLDRKYSTQHTMHITERRYIPHNIYVLQDSDAGERAQMNADLATLAPGQDFVAGTALVPHELGSSQRAFDPTMFSDLTMGSIMKAMNDFRGKQGSESSHQYANAKTAAVLDEVGLSSFPLAVTRMLIDKLFRPWYEAHPIFDPEYGGGLVPVQWDDTEFDLNFGRVQKKDIPVEEQIKLIELAFTSGAVQDPIEMRDLLEDAGLGVRKEYGDLMNQQYNNYGAMPTNMMDPVSLDAGVMDMGGGPINWSNQIQGVPPQSDPIYSDMMINVRGDNPATENNPFVPNPYSAQPSDPRLNFTETQKRKLRRAR